MSWFYPHTIQVRAIQQPEDAITNVASIPARGAWVTKQADLQHLTPKQSQERYGLTPGIAAEMFVPLADKASYQPGYEVEHDSILFSVRGFPSAKNDGGTLDHAMILLERIVEADN